MAQLLRSRHQRILLRIAALEAQLTALDAALLASSGSDTQEYRFDSGEGSQRKELRGLEAMQDYQAFLENRIEYYYAKIEGSGVINHALRRNI